MVERTQALQWQRLKLLTAKSISFEFERDRRRDVENSARRGPTPRTLNRFSAHSLDLPHLLVFVLHQSDLMSLPEIKQADSPRAVLRYYILVV